MHRKWHGIALYVLKCR